MAYNRQLTLDEARKLAEQWEGQREDFEWAQSLQARFRDATPAAVEKMWREGVNERGKPLSKFEWQALGERFFEIFGCLPPLSDAEPAPTVPSEPEPEESPYLTMRQVVRITTLSEASIKRYVVDGKFPKPVHLSRRRIAWPAREVKAWLEKREENRR